MHLKTLNQFTILLPLPQNVLAALARAVSRVHEWKSPVKLNETTRLYFARLARIEKDPVMKAAMLRVSSPTASTPSSSP
mgnify:CR=1 FL=1